MALTKVRLPVADIAAISNGTSSVTIASAGANLDINVAGVDALDISATTATVGSALTLVAPAISGETVSLSTAGGASASLLTSLSQAVLQTTSAHSLLLGANSVTGLTVGTDGKVTLGVQGTGSTHLVNKAYVDNAATASAVQVADVVLTESANGSITFPSSTGNDLIVNWGTTGSFSGTQAVVFNTAFPNSFLAGAATRVTTSASLEDAAHYGSPSTTGMTVVQSGGTATPVCWIAIGY